jgi:hypothetical protein
MNKIVSSIVILYFALHASLLMATPLDSGYPYALEKLGWNSLDNIGKT